MEELAGNHWTEYRDPNEGVSGSIEGDEGVCNPIGRKAISTIQTNQSFQRLIHQSKNIYMEEPMAPAAYVAEDGIVGYQ